MRTSVFDSQAGPRLGDLAACESDSVLLYCHRQDVGDQEVVCANAASAALYVCALKACSAWLMTIMMVSSNLQLIQALRALRACHKQSAAGFRCTAQHSTAAFKFLLAMVANTVKHLHK